MVHRSNDIQRRRICIQPYGQAEAYICAAAYPYASLLAVVFAPIHVAGAGAHLTVVLSRFATESWLRAYGVYEAVELGALLYLLYLTLRLLS